MIDLDKKATHSGKYYLVDEETVYELYKRAGFDLADEQATAETPPDFVVNIEGKEYFFTGWKLTRKGVDYEFLVELGSSFSPEELDSILPIDEDAILDEEEEEEEPAPNKRKH